MNQFNCCADREAQVDAANHMFLSKPGCELSAFKHQGRGGGGKAVKRKMKKCGKVRKKCGKMRRKQAMTRTELPVALHVVFQQHSFPVTRILVPGPKHTDGKFVF